MVFDVDLLPCAWLQMDDAARVGQHNALLAARLGRPGQRLLGQALAGWLTPASRLVFEATLMPALRSGEPIDGTTLSFCTAVGDWAVLAHFRPAHAAGKTLISAIFTSAHEQLRVHEALRHARQSLDTMPGAVLQCRRGAGGGLSFPYASAKLLDLTGVAPAALAADAQGLLDALLPDDRQRFESTLAEAEAQGDGQWSVAFCTQHQPQRRLELMARLEHGSGVWHGVIADVTERETLQQELRTQAETDALTRLPNRSMLMQRLQQCIQGGGAFALMFMDFDRFKQVNDSLGHEAGDELLRHIAQRLRHALRPTDALAARLGGDEFVVLAAGVPDGAAAQAMADRLLGILSRPYHVAGQEVVSSASIGIVLGDGRSSPAQLLRDADTAMYEAKRQGRGRWVQFSPDMHERVAGTVALEADLREALRLQQLRVVFQPIVEITSGRVTGLEALSRWHHPTRGEVSPARFIPLAEESGLINELGEHALRLACAAYIG